MVCCGPPADSDVDQFDAIEFGHFVKREPCGFVGAPIELISQRAAGNGGAVDDPKSVQRSRTRESILCRDDDRIHAEDFVQFSDETRFLPNFSASGVGRILAWLETAARQGPAGSTALIPMGQENAAVANDDSVRGNSNIHRVTLAGS